MALVIKKTDQELIEQRNKILAELGTTLEKFRAKVETSPSTLSGDEWDALFTLDGISFLLREPRLYVD